MMKKLRILFFILLPLTLDSCTFAFTQTVWGPKASYEAIESFFIDYQNKRVVLIGEAGYKTKAGTDHYSITDKSGTILKVFEIGQRSKEGIIASFYGSSVRGSQVNKVWIALDLKNMPKEDVEFLNSFNESAGRVKFGHFGYYASKKNGSKITHYPSSKEKFKNICSETNKDPNCSPILKLRMPWQGELDEIDTIPSILGRLALTPLSLAADTLMAPLNVLIFIMASSPHK